MLPAVAGLLEHTRASLEVICVDDGSTDNSARLLAELAEGDSRLKVLRLGSNRGVSAARNHGIEHATGGHISFMDADDEVPPGALDRLLHVARKTSSDIAMGMVLHLESRSDAVELDSPKAGGEICLTTFRDSRWLQSLSGHHCCNLYRRQMIEQHDIRFDTDLTLGEDQLFQVTAMVNANSIAMVQDIVYVYHHYAEQSLTRKPPSPKVLRDDLEWQRRTAKVLFEHGLGPVGLEMLGDWSYSIDKYWLRIPSTLTESECRGLFDSFRSMMGEFGVLPWHPSTSAHHRHLLELVMSGQDGLAYAFLATDEARFGFPSRTGST